MGGFQLLTFAMESLAARMTPWLPTRRGSFADLLAHLVVDLSIQEL
jgi:hypothetical protein